MKGKCVIPHLFQHVGRDVLKLCIPAAQQRGTEPGEADAASFDCPLVERDVFLNEEQESGGDSDLTPQNAFIKKTYPLTALEKNVLEHF